VHYADWPYYIQDAESFYAGLAERDLSVTGRMNMSFSLFRGASFHLKDVLPDESARARLMDVPGVKNLWPIRSIPRPNDEVLWTGDNNTSAAVPPVVNRRQSDDNGKDTYTPHVMTQVDQLRAEGITGKGVRIGVIDVGVDYTHPALGGCFGKGCLVSYGWDFVGDNYTGPGDTPHPDADPMDSCDGHGTHVSGIIAAQANPMGFTGAAPGVTLGMYKVFGCKGSSDTDIAIAALNRAYEEGSDIISMSIGRNSGWGEDPVGVAASRIVDAGVPCVLAGGNSGSGGLFLAAAGATGHGVTSVGSVDSPEYSLVLVRGETSTRDSGNASKPTTEPFGWTPGTPPFGNVSSMPLYAISNNTSVEDDACSPLPEGSTPDLSGYVVLVRQGTCSDYVKAQNIAARGARYMMMYPGSYSDPTALNPPWVSTEEPRIVGTGIVTTPQAAEWVGALNNGSVVAVETVSPAQAGRVVETSPNQKSGGAMSLFSSWGPTWEMDLKPTFSAPGGYILSTWPVALGSYAIQSGTSMSTPFTSAIFALMRQARGKGDDAVTLNNLVATTASPVGWYDGNAIHGDVPAPPTQQGGGLAQAHRAAHATTVISVSSLSFNDTAHFVPSLNFTVHNQGAEPVTYTLATVDAQTMYTFNTGNDFPAGFPNPTVNSTAKLTFSGGSQVTVPAGGSAEVTVSCEPPAVDEARLAVYSGYVTLNGGANPNDTLSIPYIGAVGSLNAAKVLDDDYVYLSHWNDTTLKPSPGNETYVVPRPVSTLPVASTSGSAIPYPATIIQLNVGTALLRCDLVSASGSSSSNMTSTALGTFGAFPMQYVPRAYFINAFTGMLTDGTVVPEGSYAFVIKALKIFGDREDPAEYEVQRTKPFTLRYQD
jgi:subtilisin family serine protease